MHSLPSPEMVSDPRTAPLRHGVVGQGLHCEGEKVSATARRYTVCTFEILAIIPVVPIYLLRSLARKGAPAASGLGGGTGGHLQDGDLGNSRYYTASSPPDDLPSFIRNVDQRRPITVLDGGDSRIPEATTSLHFSHRAYLQRLSQGTTTVVAIIKPPSLPRASNQAASSADDLQSMSAIVHQVRLGQILHP